MRGGGMAPCTHGGTWGRQVAGSGPLSSLSKPACLVCEHSLALLSVVSPLWEAVFGGNGSTLTGYPGHVRLDNVISRYFPMSTGLGPLSSLSTPCTPV
jgi:hypothetical protein